MSAIITQKIITNAQIISIEQPAFSVQLIISPLEKLWWLSSSFILSLNILQIKKANIIIWLTDERPSNRQIDEIKRLTEGKELIVVQNKIDLQNNTTLEPWICPMHFISAKEGIGIKSLEDKIIQSANIQEIRTTDVIVTSPRHLSSLTAAQKSLLRAIKALKENTPADLVAEDLRQALHELAEITGGEITSQETLNNIFSTFCVGK